MKKLFFLLIIFTLIKCDLKPIQEYKVNQTIGTYTIDPRAKDDLMEIINADGIALRHNNDDNVLIKTNIKNQDPKYYEIKRSQEGLNLREISKEEVDRTKNIFSEDNVANQPTDLLFYKKPENNNVKFEEKGKYNLRVCVINEQASHKGFLNKKFNRPMEEVLEGHKFNNQIPRIQYKDNKLELSLIDIKSFLTELKERFQGEKLYYIAKVFLKLQNHYLKESGITTVNNNVYSLKDEELDKIKEAFSKASPLDGKFKQVQLSTGTISRWFATKVDKGIYIIILYSDGELKVHHYELGPDLEDYIEKGLKITSNN